MGIKKEKYNTMGINTALHAQITSYEGVTIVVFGASGDLARKKIYPSFYLLYKKNMLPKKIHIIGYSRTSFTKDDFIKNLESTYKYSDKTFFSIISYISGKSYSDIKAFSQFEKVFNTVSKNRIYYLSLPPSEFRNVCKGLKSAQLITQNSGSEENKYTVLGTHPFTRIVFEKPFGTSYVSAQKLQRFISNHFKADQVFIIDHYLGKEPIQNLMYFRFANSIFENLWNSRYIDHIELSFNEDIQVKKRAGYFDSTGILKDMIQSHALQVISLALMEPPSRFIPNNVRSEKVKLLSALRVFSPSQVLSNVVRGQYEGYLEEEGVKQDSHTETFVALKMFVDNRRWSGVPIYVRSGKALKKKCTELIVYFKKESFSIFGSEHTDLSNKIIFRFQPNTFLKMNVYAKSPGSTTEIISTDMKFAYKKQFKRDYNNGYDRILYNILMNDGTLFLSYEELLLQWKFVDAILAVWNSELNVPLYKYKIKSHGPKGVLEFLGGKEYKWNIKQ